MRTLRHHSTRPADQTLGGHHPGRLVPHRHRKRMARLLHTRARQGLACRRRPLAPPHLVTPATLPNRTGSDSPNGLCRTQSASATPITSAAREGGFVVPPMSTHTPTKRLLRACLGCGRPCPSSPCQRCRPGVKLTHHDAEYRRNKRALLALATHCWLCGQPARADDPLVADHIVPLTAGGDHYDLQASHSSCNKRRGALR